LGGVVRAIETGWIQKQILDTAYRYQKDVDSGALEVVGVNVNQVEETSRAELLKLDPDSERRQVERLQALRARRDAAAADEALATLAAAAETEENLMPLIVHAVRVRCTLGEIAQTLREVFGSHRETIVL
jgi:methylmalonyl-CoA mutase N-terminal domain/subunit